MVQRRGVVGQHVGRHQQGLPHLPARPGDQDVEGRPGPRRRARGHPRRRALERHQALHRLAPVPQGHPARRRGRPEPAVPLQLRQGQPEVHARPRLPGDDQHRQERDAHHRPGLHRHAVGHVAAGQHDLRQLHHQRHRPHPVGDAPPAAAGPGVSVDDTSAVVAYGGDHVGIMWSSQHGAAPDGMYFSSHLDGAPDSAWSRRSPRRTARAAPTTTSTSSPTSPPAGSSTRP